MSTLLLVVGYVLAVPVVVRLVPVLRQRRVPWFVALEVGTACITMGWLLRGRALPTAVNAVALVGFALAWVATGRRRP